MGGKIVRLFSVAETASKKAERKTFREMLAFAKQRAKELAGLLFYKIDRASRNLFDYVELERLESEYGVPFISVSQPMDATPAGKMMRRTLASMAAFYTDQQSVDVREGLARRVQEGWFAGKAPYGYRNVRKDGRGLVELDPEAADNVRRIFHLFAYEPLTLDALVDRLRVEGRQFRTRCRRFREVRSTISFGTDPISANSNSTASGIRASMSRWWIGQRGTGYRCSWAGRPTRPMNSPTPVDWFAAPTAAIWSRARG